MTRTYNVFAPAPVTALVVLLLSENLPSSRCRPACRGKNNVKFEQTCVAPLESFKFNPNQFKLYHIYPVEPTLWILSISNVFLPVCCSHVTVVCSDFNQCSTLGFGMYMLEPINIFLFSDHESQQRFWFGI